MEAGKNVTRFGIEPGALGEDGARVSGLEGINLQYMLCKYSTHTLKVNRPTS